MSKIVPQEGDGAEQVSAAPFYTSRSLREERKTPAIASDGPIQQVLASITYYATLAPSSHNTQCWRFQIDVASFAITVRPDFSRRCPAVDRDDHHLYSSLGCAVENLVLAARAHGFKSNVVMTGSTVDKIRVELTPCSDFVDTAELELFRAIPRRQCTRAEYDGKPLPQSELEMLKGCVETDTVSLILLTDRSAIDDVLYFVLRANTAQIDNPQFVQELTEWMRFNKREATEKGDGLHGACVGAPACPRWIGAPVVKNFALTSRSENAKITRQVQSSAGLAVFISSEDGPKNWVEAGQALERFLLQAAALGVNTAFLNQPVEEPCIRQELAEYLGANNGSRLDFLVRFGRGGKMPMSFRRPLESVVEYIQH